MCFLTLELQSTFSRWMERKFYWFFNVLFLQNIKVILLCRWGCPKPVFNFWWGCFFPISVSEFPKTPLSLILHIGYDRVAMVPDDTWPAHPMGALRRTMVLCSFNAVPEVWGVFANNKEDSHYWVLPVFRFRTRMRDRWGQFILLVNLQHLEPYLAPCRHSINICTFHKRVCHLMRYASAVALKQSACYAVPV